MVPLWITFFTEILNSCTVGSASRHFSSALLDARVGFVSLFLTLALKPYMISNLRPSGNSSNYTLQLIEGLLDGFFKVLLARNEWVLNLGSALSSNKFSWKALRDLFWIVALPNLDAEVNYRPNLPWNFWEGLKCFDQLSQNRFTPFDVPSLSTVESSNSNCLIISLQQWVKHLDDCPRQRVCHHFRDVSTWYFAIRVRVCHSFEDFNFEFPSWVCINLPKFSFSFHSWG